MERKKINLGMIALGVLSALAGRAAVALSTENENPISNVDNAERRRNRLRNELLKEVNEAMRLWELRSLDEQQASVLGLYLHFGWSVFVIIECSLWFGIYSMLMILIGILYYLENVLSCGKGCTKDSKDAWSDLLVAVGWKWGYYYTSWWWLLGNILMPWAPPLYFYKRYDNVVYPKGTKSRYHELKKRKEPSGCIECCFCCLGCFDEDDCCYSCASVDESDVPPWMSVQGFFVTVGGSAACCTDKNTMADRALSFYSDNTERFYKQEYGENIKSFDDLFASRLSMDTDLMIANYHQSPIVPSQSLNPTVVVATAVEMPVEAQVISQGADVPSKV